ncbi:dienelactone hydrolase family protein [Cohnella suwonensis]|uniref:Dienelactone hydrolase family protein n=1 Tax=Cohnella suwonensis TaxID=696072 RepID=A0ABW0LPI1_9BACL
MWTPDGFFEQIYEETIARHRETAGGHSKEERRRQLRETLRTAIGTFAKADSVNEPELLERVDCGDYVRERVRLSVVPGLSFAAYVLVPKTRSARCPAVLAIHGHGYGSREIVGLQPDGTPDTEPPGIHQHFAVQLVKRGLVVIAPDVIGFGERMLHTDQGKDPRRNSSCYTMATHLLLYGKTLTGLRTAELLGALDYLAGREEIDPTRIGAMGFSGGALLSWACASLDERIRATVLTGFPGTFKGTIMEVYHCVDNYTPGLLAHAELPEWIGLIAPRALFVESATDDPIFPSQSAQAAIHSFRRQYEEEGAADRFASDTFEGVHEISGRKAYDWLAGTLSR